MTRIWNAYLAPACLCQMKLLKLNLSPRLWKWTKWKIRASVQLFATKLWNHRSDFTDLFLTCFHFWITLACLQQKLWSWFLKITKKKKVKKVRSAFSLLHVCRARGKSTGELSEQQETWCEPRQSHRFCNMKHPFASKPFLTFQKGCMGRSCNSYSDFSV